MAFDREDTNTIVTLHGSRGHHSLEVLQKLLVDGPEVKKTRKKYSLVTCRIFILKNSHEEREASEEKGCCL